MAGSDSKATALQQAHAEANRAYLRSLKDSLAKMDIEAIDVSKASNVTSPVFGCVFGCYYTWYTGACTHCVHCEA